MLTTADLRLPVAHGVRLIALRLLEDAASAASRTTEDRDADALHDFRVAIRRLRSWIRAFEPVLGDALKRKDLKRLKAIASATNPSRDLEVQLEWLDAAGGRFRGQRKEAAAWMRSHLSSRAANGDGAALDLLRRDFPAVRDMLKQRLSTFTLTVHADGDDRSDSLGVAIADRIEPHSRALAVALDRVLTVADEEPAHQARIEAKRLRYLIEPAAPLAKDGKKIIVQLKGLQDALGELHDTHVMAHELRDVLAADPADDRTPREPLQSLSSRLRGDMSDAFERVRSDWLEGRHQKFMTELARMRDRIRDAAQG
jgi:CHAD domain-containing protein